jgi:hypothetical protein
MKYGALTFAFWGLVLLMCWTITAAIDHYSIVQRDPVAYAGELNAQAVNRDHKSGMLTPIERINQYKDVFDAAQAIHQPEMKGGVLIEPTSTRTLMFLQDVGRKRLQETRPQD